MNSAREWIARFVTDEDGPTAVEYAVMLALIIIVCLSAVMLVGQNTSSSYTNSAAEIQKVMGESK